MGEGGQHDFKQIFAKIFNLINHLRMDVAPECKSGIGWDGKSLGEVKYRAPYGAEYINEFDVEEDE